MPFYRLYCEICNYNKITENGVDLDLPEFARSEIQRDIPKLDEKFKKIEMKPPRKQARMFKCPKCGRLIKPKKLPEEANKNENINPGSEAGPEKPRIS